MDATVMQLILQDQQIFYMLTDRQFTIVEVGESTQLFPVDAITNFSGQSILNVIPELVGSEYALEEIIAGHLPHFALSLVNRELVTQQTGYINFTLLPYVTPRGNITGLVCLAQDMTEVGEIQQQLAQHRNELRLLQDQLTRQNLKLAAANADLQRLADMKSQFVSIAAHELRSPLTSIIGYVDLLQEESYGPIAPEQRNCLQIVESSAVRLQTITTSLLDATRIEAGRVELTLTPLNLLNVARQMVIEFQPQLDARNLKLSVEAVPELPRILGDKMRAEQILNNLISNAIKYSYDKSQIEIRLKPVNDDAYVQVAVTDYGIGIGTTDQEDLFKRFFRAESAAKSKVGGTGLGLFIAQALVELHGGHIWLESELHKGSTFYVTFPVADV